MRQCDYLISASWCLTANDSDELLEDHAIIVDDGNILDILPLADAVVRYEAGAVVERPGHLLIPGLINTHTHAAMTILRGYADDMPLERWLNDAIWPAERRWVSSELVRDGTKLAVAEMLRAGITCFADQYFFPETVAEVAAELHVRAVIGTPVIDFPNPWADNAADCLSKGSDRVHDRYVDHPLVSSCFAPHSTPTVADDAFRDLRVMADQLDCPIQIHLHESEGEIAESIRQTGMRPIERLDTLGLLNSSLLAVHAVHLTDGELQRFAESGIKVAHCPRSNLKLADGFAPVAKMAEHGITVALGTDGAASNNTLDILGEMRTAALLGKAVAADPTVLPAGKVLRMATIDAARALGLGHVTGSLERTKSADITCIDLSRLNTQPVYDPLSQLIYSVTADQVTDVWVAGRYQVENSRLLHIDEDDVVQRANEWQQKISAARPMR